MNDSEAVKFARAAMACWGIDHSPRLIKNRENAVFETISPEGGRAALRLHRPGYQTDDAIRSELWWSEALVGAGLDVPLPFRTQKGDVLAPVAEAGRVASLVAWSEGVPLGEGGKPFAWEPKHQEALYFNLGAELARLHEASDAAELPSKFTRPVLDANALLGENPAWGRFWDNPALTRGEAGLLQDARHQLRKTLENHVAQGSDFGLIHADALRENIMVDGDEVKLIDFDDGVFGFRMYELGVAMSQNWDTPNKSALADALLNGYSSERVLPHAAHELLNDFTVLRGLASCGWVIGRYPENDPVTAEYAQRAVNMVYDWQG